MRRVLLVIVLIAGTGAAALTYQAFANERDFDRLMADGDRAVAEERAFQALENYSGAITLKPDSMIAHLKRGMVYRQQNELESALRDFRESSQLDGSAPRPLEELGDVLVALGRYERAIESYERSVALDEQSARVLYKLGLARYRAGLIEQAIDPLNLALERDPKLGEAHYLLGLVYRDQNDLSKAKSALQEALKINKGDQGAREAFADVLSLEGDHSRAIDELSALAALEPTRADRAIAMGLAQARAGRFEAAVVTLSRAVERFPDSSQSYAALGHVWLTRAQSAGDRVALQKSVQALTQAAARADARSDTLAELGRALMLSGDAAGAERTLRQAVARLPVPPDAYLQLATLTERGGRIEDSRDALMRYATLVGDAQPMAAIATQIADFSMRLGQPSVAVRWLDRALDEAGPTPVLLARLADAALKAGDVVRAREAVDEGLAAEPNDRPLQAIKRRLPPG